MKQEYKKSRMLFQLVVYHLLLSDLEFDSTGHKIFMLTFDDTDFDEYLRAKSHWDSDLEDFAQFAWDHLAKSISLLPGIKFAVSEILEIKFSIKRTAKLQKQADSRPKKRNYENTFCKNPNQKLFRNSNKGTICVSAPKIISIEGSLQEQLRHVKQFYERGYIRNHHLRHFEFLLRKKKSFQKDFENLNLRLKRWSRANRSQSIFKKSETLNRK